MIANSPKEMASYIKSFRKLNKISQTNLADFAGIKQATVSAFELQNSNISLDTLYKILAAAGLEVDIRPRKKTDSNIESTDWNEEW